MAMVPKLVDFVKTLIRRFIIYAADVGMSHLIKGLEI